MPRYNYTTRVTIYNVAKGLIKGRKDKSLVGFKYDLSSDGYAHFEVSNDAIFESSNQKLCNIVLNKYTTYRLNYKINDDYISQEKSAHEIKELFEASRNSKSSIKSRENKQRKQRESISSIDFDDDWSISF